MTEAIQPAARNSFSGVRFNHACFGCGDDNPFGLHLKFSLIDDGVTAPFIPQPNHQGFDNVVHGGIISAVLDEAMAWATTRTGVWAVTAEITVRFKSPLAVGLPTTVTARVVGNRGKIVKTTAELTSDCDGSVVASATAAFVRVSDTFAEEWRRKYLARAAESSRTERNSVTVLVDETAPGERGQ